MGIYDNSIVSRIQQANDIVDVISEHVSLTKKGREVVGLCPFHDDHRPSMYVNSIKQIFKCFACGAGGDVFKFVQMRENLTFGQAIERLAERAGIDLAGQRSKKSWSSDQKSVDRNQLAKANNWAAQHFQKNLSDKQSGQAARNYLEQRKITDQSMKKWRIGLAGDSPNTLINQARKKKISLELLEQAGLLLKDKNSNNYTDKFVHRLMFTITDVTGRVIAFGARTLDGRDPKYVNSPTTALFDKSNSLYGLEQARHDIVSSGTAVIVEGYTDCIMAHQFDCCNVVATLGTSFTTGQARIIRRYARKVVLIFDSDAAGLAAANRALEICLQQNLDIKIASIPQGKDPCEFLLAAGRDGFEKLVENATDVFEFKWDRLIESFDADQTLIGRKKAVDEFLQMIATSISSGSLAVIEKGLIVNRLSKIIGLSAQEINADLSRRLKNKAVSAQLAHTPNQKVTSSDLPTDFYETAQREILEILLNKSCFFDSIRQKITARDFTVPILRQIALIAFETLAVKSDASLAEMLAKTESIEVGNLIVELAQTGQEKANFQSRLDGVLDAIEQYQIQKKKSETKTFEDRVRFLKHFSKNTGKQNPYSIGM
ncbi:MAG: DNA primase, partial [Planctomycetota bacterium]